MQTKGMHTAFIVIGFLGLCSVAADAQTHAARAISRTDIAVSLYGAFNGTTTGDNVQQSPSNAAGGMVEVRHIANPILGFEATYSFNRANQTYTQNSYAVCGVCATSTSWTAVSANAHELTGDWVASLKIANLRPFALAGGGLLLNVPSGQATTTTVTTQCGVGNPNCTLGAATSPASTSTAAKPVFVYGAGLDWGLLPHIGLRFQFRGNLYQAPDVTKLYTSSGAFTHTAEPMLGAYFQF
jgi:hypothetical protein